MQKYLEVEAVFEISDWNMIVWVGLCGLCAWHGGDVLRTAAGHVGYVYNWT